MSDIKMCLVLLLLVQSGITFADFIQLEADGNSGYRVSVEYRGRKLETRVRSGEFDPVDLWESDDNNIKKISSEKLELFEDEETGSSVIIQHDGGGTYSIQGNLGDISIQPQSGNPSSNVGTHQSVFSTPCRRCLPLAQHSLSLQEKNQPDFEDDYDFLEDFDLKNFTVGRRGRNLPFAVYPEVLVLADYDLYSKNNYDTTKTRNYVASFMNGVNLRFRSFSAPTISLHIAGIIVGSTSGSFSFMSRNKMSGRRLEAPGALHNMGTHFFESDSRYPQYDMVLLLTGLDMARVRSGVLSSSTSGYAYVGGACVRNTRLRKISSVAIVEDSGGYSGVIVAAHELGHLLGSVHDGDSSPSYLRGPGARSCSWSDGYIMSDSRSSTRGVQWSRCSQKQIRFYLSTPAAQCLQNKPRSVQYYLDDTSPPGESMSLDYQCFKDKGTRACFKNAGACTQLFCYQPNSRSCLAYRPAAEGSECGKNSWCINAKCVPKPFKSNSFSTNSLVKKSLNVDNGVSVRSFSPSSSRSSNNNNNIRSNSRSNNRSTWSTSYIKPTRTYTSSTVTTTYYPNQKSSTFYTSSNSFSGGNNNNNNRRSSFVSYDNNRQSNYGSNSYNSGSSNYNSGSSNYNSGSGNYNSGSGNYNSGSGNYNSGSYVTSSWSTYSNTNQPTTVTRYISTSSSSSGVNFGSTRSTRNVADCEDSDNIQGGLSCEALFQRYAFHYCKRNQVVKKQCCQSYQKYCNK